MKVAEQMEERIEIPRIEVGQFEIVLVGDSPLISHRWSEKAKKEMLDKQMKVAKKGKDAKDPDRDFRESIYHLPDGGYGFPSVAFKNAAVSACRFTDGTKMTVARGAFHVEGEFVRIEGSEPTPREDMVRVGMGTADIRYRAEYLDWNVKVRISYNRHALSKEQIVNLFNLAGFGVGVGEWRPEKDGQFGRFHVSTEEVRHDL
jgi:hypothetical protein